MLKHFDSFENFDILRWWRNKFGNAKTNYQPNNSSNTFVAIHDVKLFVISRKRVIAIERNIRKKAHLWK